MPAKTVEFTAEEVRERFLAQCAATGGTDALALPAFKALAKDMNIYVLDPSDSDLEAAFTLADDDGSGRVDVFKFVRLCQLIKMGKVTGLGKASKQAQGNFSNDVKGAGSSLAPGDAVRWKGADEDIPAGTVGRALCVHDDGDVEVLFPVGDAGEAVFTFVASRLERVTASKASRSREVSRDPHARVPAPAAGAAPSSAAAVRAAAPASQRGSQAAVAQSSHAPSTSGTTRPEAERGLEEQDHEYHYADGPDDGPEEGVTEGSEQEKEEEEEKEEEGGEEPAAVRVKLGEDAPRPTAANTLSDETFVVAAPPSRVFKLLSAVDRTLDWASLPECPRPAAAAVARVNGSGRAVGRLVTGPTAGGSAVATYYQVHLRALWERGGADTSATHTLSISTARRKALETPSKNATTTTTTTNLLQSTSSSHYSPNLFTWVALPTPQAVAEVEGEFLRTTALFSAVEPGMAVRDCRRRCLRSGTLAFKTDVRLAPCPENRAQVPGGSTVVRRTLWGLELATAGLEASVAQGVGPALAALAKRENAAMATAWSLALPPPPPPPDPRNALTPADVGPVAAAAALRSVLGAVDAAAGRVAAPLVRALAAATTSEGREATARAALGAAGFLGAALYFPPEPPPGAAEAAAAAAAARRRALSGAGAGRSAAHGRAVVLVRAKVRAASGLGGASGLEDHGALVATLALGCEVGVLRAALVKTPDGPRLRLKVRFPLDQDAAAAAVSSASSSPPSSHGEGWVSAGLLQLDAEAEATAAAATAAHQSLNKRAAAAGRSLADNVGGGGGGYSAHHRGAPVAAPRLGLPRTMSLREEVAMERPQLRQAL